MHVIVTQQQQERSALITTIQLLRSASVGPDRGRYHTSHLVVPFVVVMHDDEMKKAYQKD